MLNIKKSVMMAGVAAFVGLTCSTMNVSAQQLSDHSDNTVSSANQGEVKMLNQNSETMWDKTKEVSSEAWDKTKDGTAKAWDKTKEVSGEAWDKTKEAVTPDKK